MDVNFIEKKNNTLMNRKEVVCEIQHAGEPTPKRDDLRKNVAGQLGTNEKFVVLKSIKPVYGGGSRAVLHVYSNEKDIKSYEKRYLLVRNKIIEAEKEGEKEADKVGKEKEGTEGKGKEDQKKEANE